MTGVNDGQVGAVQADGAALDLYVEPLTPLAFLARAVSVFADRLAVVDGDQRLSYAQLGERCQRLAGVLVGAGLEPGDRVMLIAPNTHAHLEAMFGISMAGCVLVSVNYRLSAGELGAIVSDCQPRAVIVDDSLAALATAALAETGTNPVVLVSGRQDSSYEHALAGAERVWRPVTSELAPLSINYTSGTTGRPKGAVYLHRGAYLQGLAMAYHARLDSRSVYLWTLPMFHCNGWSFPWAVTAAGGTHVCMPRVEPAEAWRLIEDEGVSHLCGAPTVLTMLMDSTPVDGRAPGHRPLEIFTGGAPPSPTLIARAEPLGINITHLYGLTETYGPAVICEWQPEWDLRNETDRSVLRARQGVANIVTYPVRVMDDEEHDVARDGESLGEVVLRGNTVMSGYYRAPDATLEATPAGWFRTGDLAVVHEDGYLELRDRRKDIIVSGGENIASIELEQAIVAYPGVADAAVVAMADELWGERPVAFVTVSDGAEVTSEGLVAYLRERLAHFKVPARIVFAEIPKTPTGKAKKYLLREYLRQYPA